MDTAAPLRPWDAVFVDSEGSPTVDPSSPRLVRSSAAVWDECAHLILLSARACMRAHVRAHVRWISRLQSRPAQRPHPQPHTALALLLQRHVPWHTLSAELLGEALALDTQWQITQLHAEFGGFRRLLLAASEGSAALAAVRAAEARHGGGY